MLRLIPLMVAVALAAGSVFGCATVQREDDAPQQSQLLRLTSGGRIADAAAMLRDASASAKEHPLAQLLATVRIATLEGKISEGQQALERGLQSVPKESVNHPTALWNRKSVWLVARCDLALARLPSGRLIDADRRALEAVVADPSEAASTRFDAQRVLYVDSFQGGSLGLARQELLALIALADRLDWGINSQGAQALALASEFYTATGEFGRAGEFAAQAFQIHARYGGQRNYFALRAQVAAAEFLVTFAMESRREEADSDSITKDQLEQLRQIIEYADQARAALASVGTDLDMRLKIVKIKARLIFDLPWLARLKASIIDGPWKADAASLQSELLALIATAKATNNQRLEATLYQLSSLAHRVAGNYVLAADAATQALALARASHSSTDLRLLGFLNSARLAYLSSPSTPSRRSQVREMNFESTDLIDQSFSDYFPGSTFIEKTGLATSAAIQWSTSLVVASGTLSPTEEYEAIVRVKGRVHRAVRDEYKALRSQPPQSTVRQEIRRYTSLATGFAYEWDNGSVVSLDADMRLFPWARLSELSTKWRQVSASVYSGTTDHVSITTIQKALRPEEVLIDFVRVDVPGLVDRIFAYVLGPSGKVVRIDLGGTDWIGPLVGVLRTSLSKADSPKGKNDFDETSTFVWKEHLWKLEAAAKQVNPAVKTLYVVPTREFAAAPLAALRTPDGRYLGERYTFPLLFAAQDLIEHPDSNVDASGTLLVGDIDYGRRDPLNVRYSQSGRTGYASSLAVTPLNADEFNRLSDLYGKRSEFGAAILQSKKGAREAEFGAAVQNRRVIHLQTHGFAVNVSPLSQYLAGTAGQRVNSTSLTANAEVPPLISYGLAMTGANAREDGGPRGAPQGDDGILSGAEVALLDMSRVRLAVLSSCDAAIGVFYSNEMMLGLAAAFDYAGVGSIIGTVTPVNDIATSRLMMALHEQLLMGKTPAEALQFAVTSMRRQSIGDYSLDQPAYWAPFVVFGVQRPIFSQP